MSYDLMVFDPSVAPRDRKEFLDWYRKQTEWSEGHSYDDPAVTTPDLSNWFASISKEFPPMNGPLASDDYENPKVTDYSTGKEVIYAAFAWSQAEVAFEAANSLAAQHGVGFFNVSSEHGEIRFP